MHLKRAVTMVAVGGACAAWLAAAATSARPDGLIPPRAPTSPIDARAVALNAEIAHLHGRIQPPDTRRSSTRNPFAFVTRRAAGSAPAGVPPAPPVAAPPFRLDGIAEDAGAGGPVRSAIISSGTDLFVVKEGEAVTAQYRVTKISPEVVELTDILTNQTVRLALR